MKRYSIMVIESLGNGREHELCQCDSNPQAIADAAKQQTVLLDPGGGGDRRIRTAKYSAIRVVDNQAKKTAKGS